MEVRGRTNDLASADIVHENSTVEEKLVIAAIEAGANSAQYAVGWFTLALINAGLAQAKGRAGLNWWLVSLLLGPIATLLIVMLDPVKPAGP